MKYLILLIFVSLLTTNVFGAENKCSEFKKLSKDYLKCITTQLKDKTSNVGIDTSNVKEKKYISDWFKKKDEL